MTFITASELLPAGIAVYVQRARPSPMTGVSVLQFIVWLHWWPWCPEARVLCGFHDVLNRSTAPVPMFDIQLRWVPLPRVHPARGLCPRQVLVAANRVAQDVNIITQIRIGPLPFRLGRIQEAVQLLRKAESARN
jgi:hypothetical protein